MQHCRNYKKKSNKYAKLCRSFEIMKQNYAKVDNCKRVILQNSSLGWPTAILRQSKLTLP